MGYKEEIRDVEDKWAKTLMAWLAKQCNLPTQEEIEEAINNPKKQ